MSTTKQRIGTALIVGLGGGFLAAMNHFIGDEPIKLTKLYAVLYVVWLFWLFGRKTDRRDWRYKNEADHDAL